MEVATTKTINLIGLQGDLVDVQTHISATIPGFNLIGMPDTALAESKDRVKAAILSTGIVFPQRKVTVNLAPASLPKYGSSFDLAIATSVLVAAKVIKCNDIQEWMLIGELGLDGKLNSVRGVLPMVIAAKKLGFTKVAVPRQNAIEAELVPGITVAGLENLAQLVAVLNGQASVQSIRERQSQEALVRADGQDSNAKGDVDFADVLGHAGAKKALEIAASGGHHVLMVGLPGVGKTMLASRLPSILPDLDPDAALEATSLHSLAGKIVTSDGIIRRPVFENPHHRASAASIIGGGSRFPRPGAISLASHGVLFLDEAPEFSNEVLQALRQPLEDSQIQIHRTNGSATFPAKFQLVLAANGCPCGYYATVKCKCSPQQIRKYKTKLSGPLLDRIDIQIELQKVNPREVADDQHRESSLEIARRVRRARQRARQRLEGTPWSSNAEVPGRWYRNRITSGTPLQRMVTEIIDKGALSLRGLDKIIRVAWTIADLDERVEPTVEDLFQAQTYRSKVGLHATV